jgi:tetratricopeptide (TPR) repeat protein
MLLALTPLFSHAQQLSDNEKLGIAIEYFQSSKYHEALLIFEDLKKNHKLNPRYIAYMGLCYYYEWDFENAYKHLEESLPKLNLFAPHERSIYYYTCAESYFALELYEKAIPHYNEALSLCYDNEKGDIYFRLGYCYIQKEMWKEAQDYLKDALTFYAKYRNVSDIKSRVRQIENMIQGCESMFPEEDRIKQFEPDQEANKIVDTNK